MPFGTPQLAANQQPIFNNAASKIGGGSGDMIALHNGNNIKVMGDMISGNQISSKA